MTRANAPARTVSAALGAVTVILAGCSTSAPQPATAHSGMAHSSPTGPAGRAGSTVSWRPCPNAAAGIPGAQRMVCAQLQVPLDYSHPHGRQISLALSELPATAPASQQQGVLLVNPGGPGAPGVPYAAQVAAGLAPSVAAEYDIVGFDTRGVGSSVPALHCDASFFSKPRPSYVPSSQAAEQVLVNRAKAYAADCGKNFGWLLPYMTTQDLARDMDSIRAALGPQQISYYGGSYGTYLGQVYATMFPHRVRRMALDSVVDPTGVWYADNIDQDYAFQGRMNAYFAWIARYDSLFHLGGTQAAVTATFDATQARLASHPIDGPNGPLIGPDELSDTVLFAGYFTQTWLSLAGALSSYVRGSSPAGLITDYVQFGQQNENEIAVYLAVECSDAPWPRNWATWNSDTRRVNAAAPYETWANAWFNASCAFWPVKGLATPVHIGAPGLPPILLLQGTLDAATPYHGALVVRRLLPSSRLVVVEGSGNHGQSLSVPANPCANGYLDRYLATGALPARPGLVNATCPAVPLPNA